MARPDCPRCGSDLVVSAVPDSPSEWVEELRGGGASPRTVVDRDLNWLCRACGHRWQPPPDADLDADLDAADLDDREPGGDPPPMRQYAELLKLGPERTFSTASGDSTLRPLPDPGRWRRVLGVLLTMATLAAVVLLALQAPRSDPDSGLPEASDSPVNVRTSTPTPSPSQEPELRGLRAVLHVEQPCWVQVVADGEILEAVTLAPGDNAVYRAKRELQLRLGNAGGVTLRVNGDLVPAGDPGEVVDLHFAWQQGEVLIERA
jgi:hypothetical protein